MPDPPQVPLRVLAKPKRIIFSNGADMVGDMDAIWFSSFFSSWFAHADGFPLAESSDLTIVPHPKNDPEAVEIIQRAKGPKDG